MFRLYFLKIRRVCCFILYENAQIVVIEGGPRPKRRLVEGSLPERDYFVRLRALLYGFLLVINDS
jgi:hypothetical protein